MHIAELDILHKGCWGSEIGIQFPEHKFSSIDCRWVKGEVVHILEAKGSREEFKQIIRYLRGRSDVSRVEILAERKEDLHLRITTKKTKNTGQFSDIFFEHDCFPVAPTRFEKSSELWTLGAASKKNILTVYALLKRKHPVQMNFLEEDAFADTLTEKQKEALQYARLFGYYEWPRKRSVTEIAKLVGIPKTVFLSHLRKAERKIIAGHISRP
jgi:predicted DNA binding protein